MLYRLRYPCSPMMVDSQKIIAPFWLRENDGRRLRDAINSILRLQGGTDPGMHERHIKCRLRLRATVPPHFYDPADNQHFAEFYKCRYEGRAARGHTIITHLNSLQTTARIVLQSGCNRLLPNSYYLPLLINFILEGWCRGNALESYSVGARVRISVGTSTVLSISFVFLNNRR
jgi:hypothetical protein